MELKDWYELAKALVTIGTLIFTAIQALLLRKQMKKRTREAQERKHCRCNVQLVQFLREKHQFGR